MAEFFTIFLDDFRTAVKKFHRLLTIGLIFVVFGHFFILEPYFGYKKQKKDNEKELQQLTLQQDKLQKELEEVKNLHQQVEKNLESINKEIEKFPSHLRDRLRKIKTLFSSPSHPDPQDTPIQHMNSRTIDGISFPPGMNQYEERVNWYVKEYFNTLAEKLEKEVVSPLIKMQKHWDIESKHELEKMCRDSLGQLKHFVAKLEPSFWHSYEGKEDTSNRLRTKIGKFFNPIQQEITQLLTNIEKRKNEKQRNIELKKKNIDRLNEDFDELKARIKDIESPIGNIPLDFTDFISIFPLVTVIFVIMLTFQMQKCKTIYNLLSREMTADKGNSSTENKEYLSRCWFLPPYRKAYERMLFNLSLLVILVIFLRSSWLIIPGSIPGVFGAKTSMSLAVPELFLFIAYIIGLVLLVGCLYMIRKIQRQE
jgi:archaellum component FlaC